MDKSLLPKGFLKDHPFDQTSVASLVYVSMTFGFNDDFDQALFEAAVGVELPPQRLEQIKREKEQISQLSTGEEVVSFIRHGYESSNRTTVCKKALTMQEAVMPPLLRRFRTSIQDELIEATVCILAHAEKRYVEQLKAMYPEIRNPYAQSLACLVFGVQDQQDMIPFLLSEYERFQGIHDEEGNTDFSQGPLLAIHILCNEK